MKKEYTYDLREFQMRSVVLLDCIDRVCREHNLRYYIIAGTLLGAVRHKGFIPWDDDIDIAMTRADYEQLMAHADEWVPKPFNIVTHENEPLYPKYFAKLEDRSTTLVENFSLGYVGGIYMDIFALDAVPDSKLLRNIHFYKTHFLRKLLYYTYRDPYKHGRGLNSWFINQVQKLLTRQGMHAALQRAIREYEGRKDCHYLMTHDDGPRAYHVDTFGEPCLYDFEGKTFCGPSDHDAFLGVLYGPTYMQLPPVSMRRSHFHQYCDLKRSCDGVTIGDLRGVEE